MKNQDLCVLQIAEMGGDAQIALTLKQSTHSWHTCNRMREALKMLRRHKPRIVIADYHYQRNFSMQRSNLDALFSTIAQLPDKPILILLSLAEDRPHLEQACAGPLGQLQPDIVEVPLSPEGLRRVKKRLQTCRH